MAPIRIAVDVAGGDFGVPVVLEGVLRARERWRGQFVCVLCGERQAVFDGLAAHGVHLPADDLLIEHCPDRIKPSDMPSVAWRKRERASIVRCVALQREGRVDASVGAGDTGMLMAAAHFILGCVKGVARPALAASIPTMAGGRALLLDVGANTNCRPEHLLAFGKLGHDYMSRFYGIERPRVALLNVGEEPTKGPRVVNAAAKLLAESCRGYTGFVEGNRVLAGDADVIVCDGFVGNVALKVCESFYALAESVLGGSPDVLHTVKKSMSVLNAESYGAVPLLGIEGIVLKAHGNSSPAAIANAVGTTLSVVRQKAVPRAVAASMGRHHHSYAAQES